MIAQINRFQISSQFTGRYSILADKKDEYGLDVAGRLRLEELIRDKELGKVARQGYKEQGKGIMFVFAYSLDGSGKRYEYYPMKKVRQVTRFFQAADERHHHVIENYDTENEFLIYLNYIDTDLIISNIFTIGTYSTVE